MVEELERNGIDRIIVRSTITCETRHGVCASCYGITPDATKIDTTMTMDVLAGRTAKCTYCSNTQPSSFDLPFFEFRGANSFLATNMCTCGYLKVAHVNQEQGDRHPITDHAFTAVGPYATDGYYCGCRGWD